MATVNWGRLIKSKTLWINLVAGIAPVVGMQLDSAKEFITPQHFLMYTSALTFVNFIVRFVTTQPLIMKKIEEDDAANI